VKRKLQINRKTGVLYLPRELMDDGFVGETSAYLAPDTLLITHPDADLDQVEANLELLLQEIKLLRGRRS